MNRKIIVTLLFILYAAALAGCTRLTSTTPVPEPTASVPATGGGSGADLNMLNEIDEQLSQAQSANIAFNEAPEEMNIEQSAIINLVLSPSLSPEELAKLITEGGVITTDSIQVTPFVRAELFSDEPGAFTIVGLPQSPEQLVSTVEPTQWVWGVTALKEGKHTLRLTLSRMVVFQGEQTWRPVKTYTKTMQVNVTFQQRLASFDWKWVIGLIFTVLIPFYWRWQDQKKKKQ